MVNKGNSGYREEVMIEKELLVALLPLIVLVFFPAHLFAGAFLIYNQDAKANGMGLAVTSSLDNPSAIFYNPALLPDQPGFGITAGDAIFVAERSYKDAGTGTTTNAKETTHHLPRLFANFTEGRLSLGIGVYTPFGLSSEWPKNWIGRYSSTYAEIKTIYVNPTVAYKFNDRVSVGFGAFYVDSSVQLNSALPLSPFPDGMAKLTADGNGLGANAGVTVKLPKSYTLSFTARTPVTIKYRGMANFYTPDDSLLKTLIPQLRDTNASTTITLPYILSGGLAKKMGALTVEADIVYTGWSALDKYTASFSDGRPSVTYLKDWHDSFSIGVGANYQWTKSIETQIGYMYDTTPVPSRTLTPDLPVMHQGTWRQPA